LRFRFSISVITASQRSSAFRNRSSPRHATGILLALISPSSLSRSAIAPSAPDPRPHAAAIITIHDAISILSIILSYLYAGATPPASSPDTCALFVPTLAVLLQLRSLPAFLPYLVLLPPPHTHNCVLCPPHTSASARTPPRYPYNGTCIGGSRHDAL